MKLFKKNTAHQPVATSHPTVASTPPATVTPTQQPRKRSNLGLFLLLLLLLVGVTAAATYKVLELAGKSTKQAPQNTASKQVASTITKTPDASSTIDIIKPMLKNPTESKDIADGAGVLALPSPLQISNNTYYTVPYEKAEYSGVAGKAAAGEYLVKLSEISKALKDKGYTEENSIDNSYQYDKAYKSAQAVCRIAAYGTPGNPQADYTISATCSDMDTYNSIAAAQKPFFDGLSTGLNKIGLYGAPRVTTSKTAGYAAANQKVGPVGVGGGMSVVYFYQTPDKKWHRLTSTGDTGPVDPSCQIFQANEDARKAYVGLPCTNDDGSQGTVKV